MTATPSQLQNTPQHSPKKKKKIKIYPTLPIKQTNCYPKPLSCPYHKRNTYVIRRNIKQCDEHQLYGSIFKHNCTTPSLSCKSHVSNQRVTDEAIAISITMINNKSLTIFDYKLIHNLITCIEQNESPYWLHQQNVNT